MYKNLICNLFHRKSWERTDRRIRRISICEDWRCKKCGLEHHTLTYFPYDRVS